ncbi:hypothetical protein IKQ26_00315 [bacterium]|nr:hypothetical protein [bacterium]
MIEFNPQINSTSPVKVTSNKNKNYLPSYLIRQNANGDTVSFSGKKKNAVKAGAMAVAASALLSGCSAKNLTPDYIKNNILPNLPALTEAVNQAATTMPKLVSPLTDDSSKAQDEPEETKYNQIKKVSSEPVNTEMMKYAPPQVEEIFPEPIPAPEPEPIDLEMVKYAPPPVDVIDEPIPEPVPAPEPEPLPKYAPPPIDDYIEEPLPEPVPAPEPEPLPKYAPPPIDDYIEEPLPEPVPAPEPEPLPKYAPPPIEEYIEAPAPEPIPEIIEEPKVEPDSQPVSVESSEVSEEPITQEENIPQE